MEEHEYMAKEYCDNKICKGLYGIWVGGEDNVSLSESTSLPNKFMLHQNYPNPFNPKTTLEYELPLNSFIKITI